MVKFPLDEARSPPPDTLVRRALDVHHARSQRASALRGSVINAALLLVLAYDLSCKCPGHTSALHYVELAAAGALCANLLQHALRLLPRGARAPPLSPRQRRLLALPDAASATAAGRCPSPADDSADSLSLSLSPRVWRPLGAEASPPRGPPSPPPPSPPRERTAPDEFISDSHELSDYLRQYEARRRLDAEGAGRAPAPPRPPAPLYQLAPLDTESSAPEERGVGAGAGSAPHVWWRLHLDPQRLTQFNLNLRLWLQVTILERLARELAAVDEALARHGLGSVRVGHASVARLRALANGAAGPGAGGGSLLALLPFLEPFADQRYVVQRIRELASGGCLSDYRWNGGGSEWDESKPTDAELLLHLLAAYLDGQLPAAAPGARPFSADHLSAPEPPGAPPAPRAAAALAIHRVSARPPHYVLLLGDETLEVARGRNNLLHTVLLFLAAAARRSPPALRRLQLGPAGLNMLWIIGR